jgi:micrococcal nuclease
MNPESRRKRLIFIGAGLALLFIGFAIGWSAQKGQLPTPSLSANVPAAVVASEQNGELASSSAKVLDESELVNSRANLLQQIGAGVRVTRVIDGDTIEIEGSEYVRYIGIDAPETVDPRKPVQCFGVEASKKNKELVEGKMVRLEKDITERDKYNRLLRYVWLGDALVNLELVAEGFAKSYSYPPDIKYQAQIVAAEEKAREDKLGLWTVCVSATTPATSTAAAEPALASSSPAQVSVPHLACVIKGNISASGEKIYHPPGCGSYSKTTIDESRGERWFCSESEAQSAGWRKALNCP